VNDLSSKIHVAVIFFRQASGMADESRGEQRLKKAQLIIAVLAGAVTLIIGAYNAKALLFPGTGGPGAIALKVSSADSGRPVSNASVELYSADNALVATAQTDAEGQLERKNLDPGNYTLKVMREGYETSILPLAVKPDKDSQFALALRSTGSPVRAALEEVGASWIKDLGSPKKKPEQAS
jgi:hypothetical protein